MAERGSQLVVRRAATGLGLFTLKGIPAGKRIVEYTGPVVTAEDVARRRGRYFFEIDEEYAVDGSPRTNTARYINHSCRPNSEAWVEGKRVWVWSKEAIGAGEEITLDYGEAYFDDYIRPKGCKCAWCRAGGGRVSSPRSPSISSGSTPNSRLMDSATRAALGRYDAQTLQKRTRTRSIDVTPLAALHRNTQ